MDWLTDEILFYVGIMMVILALVGLAGYLIVSRVGMSRLKKKLTQEYGEDPRHKK